MQLKQEQCLLEATWCRKVTKHKHLHTDNEKVVKQAFWFTRHLNKSHTAGLYWTDILILWNASSQFDFKILTKRLTCDDVTFERSKLSNNLVKQLLLLDNVHVKSSSPWSLFPLCVSHSWRTCGFQSARELKGFSSEVEVKGHINVDMELVSALLFDRTWQTQTCDYHGSSLFLLILVSLCFLHIKTSVCQLKIIQQVPKANQHRATEGQSWSWKAPAYSLGVFSSVGGQR